MNEERDRQEGGNKDRDTNRNRDERLRGEDQLTTSLIPNAPARALNSA